MADPFTVLATTALGGFLEKATDEVMPSAFQHLMKRRQDEARQALAKAMAKGKPWLIAGDRDAFLLLAFTRAAMEGTARRNLLLLAEAVVSAAHEPAFAPDEFKRQANTIAALSWDEILILATVLRVQTQMRSEGAAFRWGLVSADLRSSGGPYTYPKEVEDAAWPLVSAGYLGAVSAFGGFTFEPTRRFDALVRLVDLTEAMHAAKAEGRPSV